ncbi:PQQ-dependent sugar dehydrogenase [Microbacterium sp. No. 7]|uniref:PQQ-dependent sugar dehydrogenase n=1 Tax=Microbacterium sp. No. 7 TaxID=1714373 RepID=UPI0006D0428D|nr:PQQ-dependent sugar dehydrogenase [Microbacterium sp. No. 7]ALJ18711.1 glucose dehydrogenase [Microbacterium sp. No. 7]
MDGRRRPRVGVFLAPALAAVLLTGCTAPTPAPEPPASATPTPTPTPTPTSAPVVSPEPTAPVVVATHLAAPWSLTPVGDAVLVSERDSGRIVEVSPDGVITEVAVIDDVSHGGEGGLLGLAFDGASGLYVYSTGPAGNRVERYELTGPPGARTLGEPEPIIDALPAAGFHNGGRIAFGPDGKLYVPVGDAGVPEAAQDPIAPHGKILRLNPDGTVPDDNPVDGSPVYSLGHRNVQGLAWTDDGRLFASEFGQDTWDELNEIVPGGNYGWPEAEGRGGAAIGFVDPVLQWPTDAASPSGIAIVDDQVVIANLRGEVLRIVPVDDPDAERELFAGELGRIRDVAEAPDGTVWVVTNNTDGRGEPAEDDDRIIAVPRSFLTE